jgi:hypothetical protein
MVERSHERCLLDDTTDGNGISHGRLYDMAAKGSGVLVSISNSPALHRSLLHLLPEMVTNSHDTFDSAATT